MKAPDQALYGMKVLAGSMGMNLTQFLLSVLEEEYLSIIYVDWSNCLFVVPLSMLPH